MKNHATTNLLLLVIAIALIAIAIRPLRQPHPAQAQEQTSPTQTTAADPLYIEPGTVMLRSVDGNTQVFGKMVVDLNTGSIWGFPTLTGQPYPVDISSTKPPVSHPMFLGTFAFGDISR
nr:TonB-dependent receptor plug domain protein [uncultured Acidobacteriota bacterium]